MRHNYDEFSLQLSWNPTVNGVSPATPGFYLRAGFSNEAEATSVVKGGRNGSRVSGRFLHRLFELMDEDGLLEPHDSLNLGGVLGVFQEQRHEAALNAKRAQLECLRAEVEALEREVGP